MNIEVELDKQNRKIYIRMNWNVKGFYVSGNYVRYWTS